VILVIVYHVAPHSNPAGFLGVDLFFVLSGFLITRGLLNRLNRRVLAPAEERITVKAFFVEFYRKRLRRLFPAFAFMLLTVCSLALLAPEDVRVRLDWQILGALTFSANWVQLATGSSYFDAGTPQLLKHMWSLAVEEQFYFVWPAVMLMVAAGLAGRQRAASTLRARLARMTMIGAILSGAAMAAVSILSRDPNQAYLNSLTHASGLLLGAFVACMPLITRVRSVGRGVLGCMAAGVLVACLVVLDEHSDLTQRGGIVIFSAATAVLVRLGTTGSLARIPADRPVFAPIRWTADRSYALYLWHWPLVILAAAWIPDLNGGALEPEIFWARAAAVVLPTVLLSEISFRLFERPVLRDGFRGAWNDVTNPIQRPALGLVAAGLLAATTMAGITAPAKTQQQVQLEALEMQAQALERQQAMRVMSSPSSSSSPKPSATQSGSTASKLTPTSTITGPKGTAEAEGIDSSTVTFIGDSVTLAASPTLAAVYSKSQVQARVGQQMGDAAAIVQHMRTSGLLGTTVVLALGTNGTFADESLLQVIDASGPGRRFVFVTGYGPQPWIAESNAKLRAYAESHKDTVRIADWSAAAPAARDIAPDGVPPGPDGARIWVQAVTKAIKSFPAA
jgi:peptidoglycan/LPS O-acetylase OafA/YrhL